MNIYFLAGGQEAGVIQDCKNMMDTLSTAGFTTNELTLKSVSNGQHSEWFWKQEFPFAYKTLFTTPTYLNLIPEGEIKVYQNSVLKELNIRIGLQYIGDTYSIFDMKGILIQTAKLQKKLTVIPLNKSMQGTYLITVGNFQKKFII